METVFRDARIALRLVGRQPLTSLAVVTTLAIGLGATTAMFSAVNAVLLRELGIRQPEAVEAALRIALPHPHDRVTVRGDWRQQNGLDDGEEAGNDAEAEAEAEGQDGARGEEGLTA